jgi:putative SOS response-associated peptidase YedK
MCGRYSLARDQKLLQEDFPSFDILLTLSPRYNIAPTQPVAVLLDDGRRRMEIMNWGLIPPWSAGPGSGPPLINARSDTVAEKPSFKNALRRKRCLMPADGWYEWSERRGPKNKRPYYFRHRQGRAFAFAAIWEEWHHPEGSLVVSCAMITTEPNEIAGAVHDRMPVILAPEDYDLWLDRTEDNPARLRALLKPCPDEWIDVYPVSNHVNRVAHDDSLCIAPAPASTAGPEQLDLFG